MYRQRIEQTRTRHPAAQRLQQAMLAFHDFRHKQAASQKESAELALWQSQRLVHTHQDFYEDARYRLGLAFLFNDLYSHQDFSERDRDLERIFPKLVKLLPNKVIDTVCVLVELNLLTQELDQQMCRQLLANNPRFELTAQSYCEAYRNSDNAGARQKQLQLIHEAGMKLERYARSQTIMFALRISEGPAEMAGLSALHAFIIRGFTAFHSMQDVRLLMDTIVRREQRLLQCICAGETPETFVTFSPGSTHDQTTA